jgi:hypothetical protein
MVHQVLSPTSPLQVHAEKMTIAKLVDNTTILAQAFDKTQMQYLEAMFIVKLKPLLNIKSS